MKKDAKKIIRVVMTWVVTAVMASVFILDIFVDIKMNNLIKKAEKDYKSSEASQCDDKIHFLSTANSDCIIIESNGKFALIDSGEGNENPRRERIYQSGFEKEVLDYIKNTCADENGEIQFEFAVATHMHYDHSGNFQAIINCPNIKINKFYIKEYTGELAGKTDSDDWGNMFIYEGIIDALKETNTPIEHNIPDDIFNFGDFTIQFFNTKTPQEFKNAGENANSIGVKVTKGENSAFLAADFTNGSGFEMMYAEKIGDIDLLKMGHHGYFGSSSRGFLEILKPEIAICTNYIGKIYPNVKWNLTMVANTPIFSTQQRNGIVAEFGNEDIKLVFNN